MRIVLTGGGTGGHVTPLLAVAEALRTLAAQGQVPGDDPSVNSLEIIVVGALTDYDRKAFAAAGIPCVHVPSGKIRRYLSGAPRTVFDLLVRVPIGIVRALWKLFFLMPDVVFSKGGYGSVPVTIAAWVYRIPILLHETDAVPGLANRRLARYASAVAVSFRAAEQHFPIQKVFVSGTPLRRSFTAAVSAHEARQRLNLHDRKPVLFVTGGSQGAQRINTAVLAILIRLLSDLQVLHQVGEANVPAVRSFIERDLRHAPDVADYHLVGTLSEEDMAFSMASADLILTRAGGTTLAEIAAVGTPALIVPLTESAQDHQWENAYFFREHGAAVVLDENNLSPAVLLSALSRLFSSPQDLQLMRERMRSLHRPEAANELAVVLINMAQGRVPRRLSSNTSEQPVEQAPTQ